jgi:hypothetical protein
MPGSGEGVDRSVMWSLLQLSPIERIARAALEANNLSRLDEAASGR